MQIQQEWKTARANCWLIIWFNLLRFVWESCDIQLKKYDNFIVIIYGHWYVYLARIYGSNFLLKATGNAVSATQLKSLKIDDQKRRFVRFQHSFCFRKFILIEYILDFNENLWCLSGIEQLILLLCCNLVLRKFYFGFKEIQWVYISLEMLF